MLICIMLTVEDRWVPCSSLLNASPPSQDNSRTSLLSVKGGYSHLDKDQESVIIQLMKARIAGLLWMYKAEYLSSGSVQLVTLMALKYLPKCFGASQL